MFFRLNKQADPVNPVAFFPGGGRFGYISVRFAQAVEQAAGTSLSHLFPGGVIGSSVGSITASVVATDTMSLREYGNTFLQKLPYYMSFEEGFYKKQIRQDGAKIFARMFNSVFKKARAEMDDNAEGAVTYHLDRKYMKSDLLHQFGELKMSDAHIPFFITSQKISPGPQTPYDFYHVNEALLKQDRRFFAQDDNPTANVPIRDAIMAATAMQTVFPSYEVEETGTHHIDVCQMDSGLSQVDKLKQSLKNGYDMAVVQFDHFLENFEVNPNAYNRNGVLMSLFNKSLTDFSSFQARLQNREGLRVRLGDNFHLLEVDRQDLEGLSFNTEILDTSPLQIQEMRKSMDDYIERRQSDMIDPVVDFLVENRAKLDARHKNYQMPDFIKAMADRAGGMAFKK